MSVNSDINLKQMLRKIEYPLCAKEALNKIVELICGRITSLKSMDLALDLMAEFIFCEIDRRGQKKTQLLSPLLELQLLAILYDYFDNIFNESGRNTVFLSLFSGTTAGLRLGVLSKLVSFAIAIPSSNILISTSAWMQQLGNTSPNSCKLAQALVQDYFYYNQNSVERMKTLPKVCPQFTANFMTALAESYFSILKKDIIYPPKMLLEVIKSWITDYSGLCIAAQQKQVALPPGAIAMEATTPVAGLLKWCILAPIHRQHDQCYNDLHLAILNSIMETPSTYPPKMIYAQHLAAPINPILSYVNDLKNKQDLKLDQLLNEDSLQLSLDRFAQSIQVAFSANALYGHVDDFFHQLKILPFNKLMSIIINNYKQNKVIVL